VYGESCDVAGCPLNSAAPDRERSEGAAIEVAPAVAGGAIGWPVLWSKYSTETTSPLEYAVPCPVYVDALR
jgi:hypothetical protein